MKSLFAPSGFLLLFVMLAMMTSPATAQAIQAPPDSKSQEELDKTIKALDTALFDSYNQCDSEKFSTFFTDDVEFYHDQGGLTLGKEKLPKVLRTTFAAAMCGANSCREPWEAHSMKGYGAIEIGVHRFLHPKSGNPAGEGRFVHLWQFKDGAWKITRALSFDYHQAAAK